MKRKALGRGLDALIPGAERPDIPETEIDLDRIDPNPRQPRMTFDESRMEELAASVRENGVLQPVLVRRRGDRFQLVAGERRLGAAQRAGLLKIPAVIRDVPDDKLLELALIENIQREQLNSIEEAQAYQSLIDNLGLTQEDLAERLGKDRSTVANGLRLLKLPPAVRELVADGKLSAGHARALLASGLPPSEMAAAASSIVERGWSVRDAERWAKGREPRERSAAAPDPNIVAAADKLCRILGTKVEIRNRRRGAGTIRIHFFNDEDLIRIYSLLTGTSP
jgi:ParB family chromosome partitioning protein